MKAPMIARKRGEEGPSSERNGWVLLFFLHFLILSFLFSSKKKKSHKRKKKGFCAVRCGHPSQPFL